MNNQNWFAGCQTAEQVKIEYRRLCKLWHPDLGTPEKAAERTVKMQEINAVYAIASARYRQEEMREKAKKYNRPEPTEQDYTDAAAVDERIRQAIEQIIRFEFLEVEICGLWVWIGGTQKRGTGPENDDALDALMAAGFKWSHNKSKWYFAGVPAGGWGKHTMDEIRRSYGSQIVRVAKPGSSRRESAIRRVDE